MDNDDGTPITQTLSDEIRWIFNHRDQYRRDLVKLIIMYDYPLNISYHLWLTIFAYALYPGYDNVSLPDVEKYCYETYEKEKQKVIKSLEGIPGRFCLTLDVWTSKRSLGYVFITGHFINSDWKIQKQLLNVLTEPFPESDAALSNAVANCVSEWGLEGKLFSVTFNHLASKTAIENIRPLLCIKNPGILDGQMVIGNCVARTFSNFAKHVLDEGKDVIKKVRDCVKHAEQNRFPTDEVLSLDDQTQWNTTYKMLVAASELKQVFSWLEVVVPDYNGLPSEENWRQVEALCTFLKPLFEALSTLQSTENPSAVTFFHEVWKTHSDLSLAISGEDSFVAGIAKSMKEKVDKYWRECSLVLAMAVVMDPRFKMNLVENSFSEIFGEDAGKNIKTVDDGIHELFSEYIKETTSQNTKSELDQYLDETPLPRVEEFDVLDWWKQNELKFPILCEMARDVLSIPVSAAALGYVFDVEPREMDEYKTSLRPMIMEALICAREWLLESDASSSSSPSAAAQTSSVETEA